MAGAAWLRLFLAPLDVLWQGESQPKDNRLNFRDGFTASQVADSDGKDVLTIDVDLANIDENATNSTVPIRTVTGGIKGTTFNGTGFTFATAREVTRVLPISLLSFTGITIDSGTGGMASTTLVPQVVFQNEAIGLIDGSVWTELIVRIFPATGRGSLPATFPEVQVWRVDEDGNRIRTDVSSTMPAFADPAAYEAGAFNITVDMGNHQIDLAAFRYIVEVYDETGGGAIFGNVIARESWTALEAAL